MDYILDSELQLLADSVARFAADRREAAPGDDWAEMAALGWTALPFPEEAGGIGMGAVGTMVLIEGLAAARPEADYLASVVLAGGALLASPAHRGVVEAIAEGRARCAVAGLPLVGARPAAVAEPLPGGGARLSGTSLLMLGGRGATQVVVPAQLGEGAALYLLDLGAPQLRRQPRPLLDGGAADLLDLDGVEAAPGQRLDSGDAAGAVLARLRDAGLIAAAADNLGAMQVLMDAMLEHARTRRQFGRPLGAFQELQFRLVDAWIKLDEARSLLMTAAMAADAGRGDAARLAAAAWVQSLWSARVVGEEAVQLHGGLGMTEELAVGRYVKRLLVNELMFGGPEAHLTRFASMPDTLAA